MLRVRQCPGSASVASWALLATIGVLASGCGVGERPTLGAQTLTSSTLPIAATELNAEANPAGDQPAADGAVIERNEGPSILVSPTGVVAPVVGVSDDGYQVRTPCGEETTLVWGQPITHADIVLDAGHGGDERGAIGPSGETEAELNLDIARRAAARLEREGVSVLLTRTSDYRITVQSRALIADHVGASALVSIHHNSPSVEPSDTPGTEVYVQIGSDDSRRLGGLIHQEVIASISGFDVEWTSTAEPGVLTVVNPEGENAYGINRHPDTASVLAELAYISNPAEATLLATDEYRDSAAGALTRAIVRYLMTDDEGTGFVDEPRLFTPSGVTGGTDGCIDPLLE